MSVYGIIFILSAGIVFLAYLGYPLYVGLLARLAGNPVCPVKRPPQAVSIVIAAHNEAGTILRRILELRRIIDRLDPASEIIIVSDGSTDGTDRLAREAGDPKVRVIQQPRNMGKAEAINAGVAATRNEIIVLGDARQQWAEDAVEKMLENYGDPDVGAVSGDLVLKNDDGTMAGVGLYWKLEKWIRHHESLSWSSVGVTGAICSLRRELYVPMPAGTILDDVCWPMSVAMQGKRVIHEVRAQAFDRLPAKAKDEIRRKVRTLSGNFQLLMLRPGLLVPGRNPLWAEFVGHKLLRLLVPLAMIAALVACVVSAEPWLRAMLGVQLLGYAAGMAGLVYQPAAKLRLVNAASSLLVLNTAALLAWCVFFSGRCGKSWKKVTYDSAAKSSPGPLTAA